jgi:hypothetical protein
MNQASDISFLRDDPKARELVSVLRRHTPEQIEKLQQYFDEILSQSPDLPPVPPKDGHKFIADRGKVSAMMDSVLIDLLEETRRSLRIPLSRMVELIVWEYFGRPALSFESNTDETKKGVN